MKISRTCNKTKQNNNDITRVELVELYEMAIGCVTMAKQQSAQLKIKRRDIGYA